MAEEQTKAEEEVVEREVAEEGGAWGVQEGVCERFRHAWCGYLQ